MISKKTLFLVSILLIVSCTGVVFGATNLDFERVNPMETSNSTSSNTPLVELDYQQEIPSGSNTVRFVTVTNNYDESQDITFDINNSPEMTFTDGSNVKTFTVGPNSEQDIYVDTAGPQRACSETQQRRVQTFTYESTSSTYTINTTENTVEVCRPGGGGGGGQPGEPTKPPASDVYTISNNGPQEKIFQVDQGQNPTWDFGDGDTGSGYYITHQYPSEGEYTATLTVTINGNQYTYTEQVSTGPVSGPDKPPASEVYTISNPTWTSENTRIFQVDQGQNPTWNFGDGSTQNSYYVQYEYASAGTYEVTFEVTINGTRYQYTETITI